MRFRTRAFLLCFVPFALLLSVSFWLIERQVQAAVRGRIRISLRENQQAFSRIRAVYHLQDSRFLSVAGENSALKAGIELLLSDPRSQAAVNTLQDELGELCAQMGFDLLQVSAPDGTLLAGVQREKHSIVPAHIDRSGNGSGSLLVSGGRIVEVAAVPVNNDRENIASLDIGQYFDLSVFTVPTVLLRRSQVMATNLRDFSHAEILEALRPCGEAECDIRLHGENYVSIPMSGVPLGAGFVLRSLENVDRAAAPTIQILRNVFISVAAAAVLLAFFCSVASARTIVRPLAELIRELGGAAVTGVLPHFDTSRSGIREVTDLAESFNRAATAVQDARDSLQHACIEFTGSLAHALDARDRYTAGHSLRVSQLSCATAAGLGLTPIDMERIRIGALLHDIGKIGVPDHVLQKPGRLTDDEFAMVKQHPQVGRRILEGVQGLAPYLSAVELHHENWDGTGYPLGQAGLQTPVDARIIHIADAYDAMTTDRPYRRGMSRAEALRILRECAGTQFDPHIVEVFTSLADCETDSLADAAFEDDACLLTV